MCAGLQLATQRVLTAKPPAGSSSSGPLVLPPEGLCLAAERGMLRPGTSGAARGQPLRSSTALSSLQSDMTEPHEPLVR